MLKTDSNIIHDLQGVGYSNHTLTNGSPIHGSYTVKDGTESVMGIAFRKREQLSSIVFPDGLLSIGDASFSHCKALRKVTIPASVEYIGVAAFCKSGLEEVTFLGTPKVIDHKAFYGCDNLKRIYVPVGSIDIFAKYFAPSLIKEVETKNTTTKHEPQYHPRPGRVVRQLDMFGAGQTFVEQPNLFSTTPSLHTVRPTPTDLLGQTIKKCSKLTYNYHDFSWAKGDFVSLDELFSGPTILNGNPSYQFRRKCLFVFMKQHTANTIPSASQYNLPANTKHFTRKYAEKYGNRTTRIFLFICEDGKNAQFYDEVMYVSVANNAITVKSVL